MQTNRRITTVALTGVAVVASLIALFATTVSAQAATFGTQVKPGDSDFIVVNRAVAAPALGTAGACAAGAGTPIDVVEVDLGTAADVTDNAFVLDMDDSCTVTNFDVRLVASSGKAAGTLIGDSDNAEKTNGAVNNAAAKGALVRGDLNNNGRYDVGDYAFLTSNAPGAAGLVASTGNALWTIRLTPSGGKAAGTLVFAQDSDFTSYNAAASSPAVSAAPSVGWFDADLSVGGAFTTGDAAYIVPGAAALAANALFPIASIRVSDGNAAGAFGTQAKPGDRDFIPGNRPFVAPLLGTGGACVAAGGPIDVVEVDLGTAADVTDNAFVLDMDDSCTVTNYDVRLVASSGKAAGTLIGDSDNAEKTNGAVNNAAAKGAVVRGDANNNGRYDVGDYAFITSNAPGAAGLVASTGNALWTIRLTPSGSKAAGTLVFAQDSDFTSYNAAASSPAVSAAPSVAWFDADLSAGGAFTTGDSPYLVAGGAALGASALFPIASIRLGGPQVVSPTGTVGSTTGTTGTTSTTGTTGTTSTTGTTGMTTGTTATTAGTTPTSAAGTTSSSTKTPGFEFVALMGAATVATVLVLRRKAE
jgi:hypothetical protein